MPAFALTTLLFHSTISNRSSLSQQHGRNANWGQTVTAGGWMQEEGMPFGSAAKWRKSMKPFILYRSGIPYAKLALEEGKWFQQKRELRTGDYGSQEELSEEENQRYLKLTRLNIKKCLLRITQLEKLFSGGGDVIRTQDGEQYTLWEPTQSEDSAITGGPARRHLEQARCYVQRDVKFPCNLLFLDGKLTAFYTAGRNFTAILVREGAEGATFLSKWREAFPNPAYRPVSDAETVWIPMRDGVRLAADLYLPADLGEGETVPAILVRTPYGKEDGAEQYLSYVQRGYGVVIQDVRGRNESEGEWLPNYYEIEDGDDTLNWIASQSWCSKKIGMAGGSYLGYVQWAAAASGNPYLAALISEVTAGSAFVDLPRRGGCFTSGMMAWAFSVSQKRFQPEKMEREDWAQVLNIRPLEDIPQKALGYEVPFLSKWLAHPDYDEFWERSNWTVCRTKEAGERQIPALIQSGWFDDNGMGTTEALEWVQSYPREKRKVLLGPWHHSGNSRYDLHSASFGCNALRFDIDLIHLQWFDHFLKGIENRVEQGNPVEYYTCGENKWKSAESWPCPHTMEYSFYLTSGGKANTSGGDGELHLSPVEKMGKDTFTYDPKEPSVHIIDMSENEIEVPENYAKEEKRQDILCYTSEALAQELTITGDLLVELYISSTAPDTDFVVRLTDVDETGKSIKLADGVLDAKYRDGFGEPKPMEKGKVYRLSIRTTKLSNTFRKGHRIRVTVTSSAKNFIFPNSNTMEGFNSQVSVKAKNTVYHGGSTPSRVVARVEPTERFFTWVKAEPTETEKEPV